MRVLVLAMAALSLHAGELKLTDEMWNDIRPIYTQTLAHPFLKGLTDGTLPRARFQFYIQQDAKYLRVFGQALSVLSAKAPRQDWSITLNQHALGSVKEVDTLHQTILKAYGVPLEQSRAVAMALPSTTRTPITLWQPRSASHSRTGSRRCCPAIGFIWRWAKS